MGSTFETGNLLPLYRPLNEEKREVRFVRIVGESNESIACEMKVFSLDNRPAYKALSYCWTEALATEKIRPNDCSFYIRPNLHNLLQQISKEESDWFFIDAVCINQEDLGERTQAVGLMPDIYSDAEEVVVWLGLDESQSPYARPHEWVLLACIPHTLPIIDEESFFARYDAFLPELFRMYVTRLIAQHGEPEAVQATDHVNPIHATHLLGSFVTAAYWARAWIIQEVVLAGTI